MSSIVQPMATALPSRFRPQERATLKSSPGDDVQASPEAFGARLAADTWTPDASSLSRSPLPAQSGSGRADAPAPKRVYLHACGRLENVLVDRLSLNELAVVARRAFDFRADQDLVLADREGEPLSGDAVLRTLVDREETIYVRLSEGALHDFEQRIDQLQHMQIGFLCDQLSTLRQEQAELRTEIRHMRVVLEQEQAARENTSDVLRRSMEDVRVYCQVLDSRQDERLNSVESTILDLRAGLRDEALAREHHEQDSHRQLQEFRGALQAESRAREHADERLRREAEEEKRSSHLAVNDLEEFEARWERRLQDAQRSSAETHDRLSAEATELRKQIFEVKQAASTEQRERISADSDLSGALKELRGSLALETRERGAEMTRMSTMRDSIETSLEAERMARESAVKELTQQLSVAVEGIQEEQALRCSEDAELSQMLEVLRRSVDEAKRRQTDAELAATRAANDLAKRFDEEVHARSVEVSKLMRLLSEENVTWQEAVAKINRMMTSLQEERATENERRDRENKEALKRIDACQANIKAESKQRVAMAEELSDRMLQQRRQFMEENKQFSSESLEVNQSVVELREIFDKERTVRADLINNVLNRMDRMEERLMAETEQSPAVKELRDMLEREQASREKGLMALSRKIGEALTEGREDSRRADPVDVEAISNKIRNECLEVVHTDMDALREGLTKVVEAVQQERRSRSEGDNKLREDCREAIQKEINARVELAAKVSEDIEAEGRARMEAVEVIELAIQECRQGIENHTHEFDAPATTERGPEEELIHSVTSGSLDLDAFSSNDERVKKAGRRASALV